MKAETIEGNKLVAEFNGAEHRSWKDNYQKKYRFNEPIGGTYAFSASKLEYHSSWDWQIPAIKKFKALDIDNNIYRNHVLEIDSAVIDEYDITQSFAALVDGIKWYNQNK
jgi:hypothetical protein